MSLKAYLREFGKDAAGIASRSTSFVTVSSTTSYTCPSNGFITVRVNLSVNGWVNAYRNGKYCFAAHKKGGGLECFDDKCNSELRQDF